MEEEEGASSSYLDETIVDEGLIGSQFSLLNQEEEDSSEDELVDLLADLAAEGGAGPPEAAAGTPCSPKEKGENVQVAAAGSEDDNDSGDSTKDMFSDLGSPDEAVSPSSQCLQTPLSLSSQQEAQLSEYPQLCASMSESPGQRTASNSQRMSSSIVSQQDQKLSIYGKGSGSATQCLTNQPPVTPLSLSQQFKTPSSTRRKDKLSTQRSKRATVVRLFDSIIDPDSHITDADDEDEDEDETLEMSQIVWETVETPQEDSGSRDSSSKNMLNASLWGPDADDDADFLKQLEW